MRRLREIFFRLIWIDPRSIWRRYVIALTIILTLYTSGHFLSISATNAVTSDAAIGLLMSRQEALSQKIFVNSHRLINDRDDTVARDELNLLIDEFEAAHGHILDGVGDPALKPMNSDRLRSVFYDTDIASQSLNEKMRLFLREARFIQVANLEDKDFTRERIEVLRKLRIYDKLEAATEAFHLDSVDRGNRLHMVQMMILLAGILTILFEACLIFWPAHIATKDAMRRLEGKSDELLDANKRLHTSLREADSARREADQSNNAKSMFLANMSHELRTPLNAIIGFSSMIKAEIFGSVGSPRYKEYANDIERSGTHLLDLIGDLMNLSQIETGTAQMDPKTFVVAEMMNDVRTISSGWPMARRRSISFVDGDDVETYFGDALRLRQIVLNLLSNAIKFTSGEAQIHVTTRAADNGGLQIVVEDSGRGFDLEQIETLIEPFQRGDDAFTRSREGTGLGLALVVSFVKLHAGTLQIENVETGGACVTVTLPPAKTVKKALPFAA